MAWERGPHVWVVEALLGLLVPQMAGWTPAASLLLPTAVLAVVGVAAARAAAAA